MDGKHARSLRFLFYFLLVEVLVVAACTPAATSSPSGTKSSVPPPAPPAAPAAVTPIPTPPTPVASLAAAATPAPVNPRPTVDLKRLPIGDGKLTTMRGTAGSVYRCGVGPAGDGAFQDGPWVKSDGTFDFTAKATVDGGVTWPFSLTITPQGNTRVIASNDLPNHPTGTYPVSASDDAYQYDRNPNRITSQSLNLNLPRNPTPAASGGCLTAGAIGVLLTGTVFFDAMDARKRDAVAHEVQDTCQGHPERTGMYHYHNLTTCLSDPGISHSALLGYALDGFGIYGIRGDGGITMTNADLDECHGHTHTITWDEQQVNMFHYHATQEYPYTLSCFRGAAIRVTVEQQPPTTPLFNPRPPLGAVLPQGAGARQSWARRRSGNV